MSKEAIKNLLMDFMADYDPNKWSNDDVYEKYAEKIDKVRSMGEIIAFTELAKKFKDIEAKLTQAKMNESFEKETKDNAFKFIEELKQQLAEKEKEYKFKLKEMDNEYKKEFKTFEEDCKHLYKTETKKAIDELEKVIKFMKTRDKDGFFPEQMSIAEFIDQQIKELKGGKNGIF